MNKPDFDRIARQPPSTKQLGWKRMAQCERQSPHSGLFMDNFMNKLTEEDFRLYPDQTSLKRKLATYHGVKEENILLAAGSDMAIKLVFDYYVENYVATTAQYFPMYGIYAEQNGAKVVNCLEFFTNKRFDLGVMANPNSPTGEYRRMKEIIPNLEKNTPFLVDEAYIDYVHDPDDLTILIHHYSNLIISRSFSKGLGAAGIRLGYLIAHEATIAKLSVLDNHYGISGVSLKFGEHVIDNIKEVKNYCADVRYQMQDIEGILRDKGIECRTTHGNWIHIAQSNELLEFFDERKIEVKPCCVLPESDLLWIRVTVGDRILYDLEDL